VAGGGRLAPKNTNFHFVENFAKFCQFSIGPNPPTSHIAADILHFSAFCLHVMPSLLPLSPLLGPMVSILEHLCLPKTPLTKFWKKIPQHQKYQNPALFVSQKVSSVSIVYFY